MFCGCSVSPKYQLATFKLDARHVSASVTRPKHRLAKPDRLFRPDSYCPYFRCPDPAIFEIVLRIQPYCPPASIPLSFTAFVIRSLKFFIWSMVRYMASTLERPVSSSRTLLWAAFSQLVSTFTIYDTCSYRISSNMVSVLGILDRDQR